MYRTLPYMVLGALLALAAMMTIEANRVLGVFLLVGAGICCLVVLNYKCPRCRFGIDGKPTPGYSVGYVPDPICPRCGRVRRGVWPFQYLLRPER